MKRLVDEAWPRSSGERADGAKGWFENNYVKRLHLTRVKQANFSMFIPSRGWTSAPWEDHSKVWSSGREAIVFTAEPYDIDSAQADAIVAAAKAHGLKLYIGAHSPHNPGGTVLVVMSRREELPWVSS